MWLLLLSLWSCLYFGYPQPSSSELLLQISTTEQLLQLYRQKLFLLRQLYQQHYSDLPQISESAPSVINGSLPKVATHNSQLILLTRLAAPLRYLPTGFLLSGNRILSALDYR